MLEFVPTGKIVVYHTCIIYLKQAIYTFFAHGAK